MHATMVFGSVLASGTRDPGVLYAPSCKGTPMVLVLGFLALAFTLLDVGLMMLSFLFLRRRDGHRLWVALALHLAAAASVRVGGVGVGDGDWVGLGWAFYCLTKGSSSIALTQTHTDALQPAG